MILATAPTRIDLAGGWTDVPLFATLNVGCVLNVAINLRSKVFVYPLPKFSRLVTEYGYKVINNVPDDSVQLYSSDFEESEVIEDIHRIELTGSLALAKAALKRLPSKGIKILTSSEAPAGSGLGTSASMGVALLGALATNSEHTLTKSELAELAVSLETEELQILSGKQDHYAAAHGGVALMYFHGNVVSHENLEINPAILTALQERLILCYTGKQRLSSAIHEKVVENFNKNDDKTLTALVSLAALAPTMAKSLVVGDLDDVGELLAKNWECQKQLSPAVTNPLFEEIIETSYKNGAIGAKACGAGGQGCIAILCELDATAHVKRTIKEKTELLRYNFDNQGLQVISVKG